MAKVQQQLEAVAAAIERLRTATGPVARVQAVQAAADVVGGLTQADREVLARGFLAHGAPVAGRVLDGDRDGQVPPDALLAVAQDLLALAPIETERLASELRQAAEVPAATTRPAAPARSRSAGTPVHAPATAAAAPSMSTPPPVPDTVRRRARGAADARGPTFRAAATSAARPWDGTARQRASLADQLRAEPELRGRLERLAALTRGRGPLTGPEVLELLRTFPDGWQRRTALRRVVSAPGVDLGTDAVAVVEQFARAGDRFTVAAQLVREAGVPTEQVVPALGARPGLRLRARAGRVPAQER